jgi:membrane protein implicated in regulation of membrane protease activity
MAYAWACIAFKIMPMPRVSGAIFILWLFGGAALSTVVARKTSRWWYAVTVFYLFTYLAIVVGEYLFER